MVKRLKYSFRDLDRIARKRLDPDRYMRFTEHARVAQETFERELAHECPSRKKALEGRAITTLEAIRVAEVMGALARLIMEQRGNAP